METYIVPLELFAENRTKVVERMREYLSSENRPVKGFIWLQGGDEQTRYCTDHVVLFRQESYFAYLFGVKEPGFYGAIGIACRRSILFIPRLSEAYAVWMGKILSPSYFKELYGVDACYYVDEMPAVFGQKTGTGEEKPVLYVLYGLNTDSGNYSKPAAFPTNLQNHVSESARILEASNLAANGDANKEIEPFETDSMVLHPILNECRAHKSKLEIDVIRYANLVSSATHVKVMRTATPGMKEYQLESTFRHEVYFEGGCRHCSTLVFVLQE